MIRWRRKRKSKKKKSARTTNRFANELVCARTVDRESDYQNQRILQEKCRKSNERSSTWYAIRYPVVGNDQTYKIAVCKNTMYDMSSAHALFRPHHIFANTSVLLHSRTEFTISHSGCCWLLVAGNILVSFVHCALKFYLFMHFNLITLALRIWIVPYRFPWFCWFTINCARAHARMAYDVCDGSR